MYNRLSEDNTPLKSIQPSVRPAYQPHRGHRTRRGPRRSRGSCDQGTAWLGGRGSDSISCVVYRRLRTQTVCLCGRSRCLVAVASYTRSDIQNRNKLNKHSQIR